MHLMRRKKKSHTLFRMFSGVDDSLKCLFLLLYEEERDLHFKGEKNPFLLLSPHQDILCIKKIISTTAG